jgi:hypothetical protein
MNLKDIIQIRLSNQQLRIPVFHEAKEIVHWMGAMQAQDYQMAKWAIGIRLLQTSDQDIEKAFNDGQFLRTHLLRPTWHLVSPENIRWMIQLTAPQVKTITKTRDKNLELNEKLYAKSNSLIEKALTGAKHLTREELMVVLEKNKIVADGIRAAHLLMRAELEGIVCSGAIKEKNHTYALLEERVLPTKEISREEALAKLAGIYFSSHAPATVKDFAWWSGLSLKDARQGVAFLSTDFVSEEINGEHYWLPQHFTLAKTPEPSFHFLPAFDEYLISYKDRTVALLLEHQKKAFTSNGIFKPVLLMNGEGIGVWSRSIKNEFVYIETSFFKTNTKRIQQSLEKEAQTIGNFLQKSVILQ